MHDTHNIHLLNRCLECDRMLESHNSPSVVFCHTFDGPVPAQKITLRCKTCALNYRCVLQQTFFIVSQCIDMSSMDPMTMVIDTMIRV